MEMNKIINPKLGKEIFKMRKMLQILQIQPNVKRKKNLD